MHLVAKSRLPPVVSPQLLACFVIWVQCLGFTRHLSATYCAHLVLISSFLFPQCAFQLPASIWFHIPVSPRWPLHNFLPLCCFNIRTSPAPLCLSATSCMHLASISRLPLSLNNFSRSSGFNIKLPLHVPLIKLPKLPAFIGFQHLCSPGTAAPLSLWHIGFPTSFTFCPLFLNFYSSHLFRPFSYARAQPGVNMCGSAPLGGIHLVSISKLPPLAPLSNFTHSFTWSQDFTSSLLTTFCMHLNLVSMSRLPPCLSTTSRAHLASISNFPPVPLIKLPKLPAFIGFQYLFFPCSLPTTSCVHFVLISKLPPRCPSTTSCIHLASIVPVPLSNFLHSFGFKSGSTVAS